MTGYRYTDPLVMAQTIADGKADIIGGARYLISDPEFANKAKGRAVGRDPPMHLLLPLP